MHWFLTVCFLNMPCIATHTDGYINCYVAKQDFKRSFIGELKSGDIKSITCTKAIEV
jgi:hypothetical protein